MATYRIKFIIFLVILQLNLILGHNKEPHFVGNRSVIVHLFEWNWVDIAKECENFLGPKGYGGVQISPPSEHVVVANRPWWERYQPISYRLISRSGTESELRDMIRRCNAVGVRIYVDAVINHMARNYGNLTLETSGSILNYSYPAIIYNASDFNSHCDLIDFNNIDELRNCRLVGLFDLNQTKPYVRSTIANYMNELIDMGVAGFRIDGAKHMWPEEMLAIFSQLHSLPTQSPFNFTQCARPYIYQEVIDTGTHEVIKASEYVLLGDVTEFKVPEELGRVFRGENDLKWLKNWGPEWSFLATHNAFVFVDNHDNQRQYLDAGNKVLSYRDGESYKMALIFLLAHPYGKVKRIMSSFNFTDRDEGPRMNKDGINNISPKFLKNDECDKSSGWICEHRWLKMTKMVEFLNIVGADAELNNWWDNGKNQIAFGRGNKGFIVINMDKEKGVNTKLQTSLPAGVYCNMLGGSILTDARIDATCTDQEFHVNEHGVMQVKLARGPRAITLHTGGTVHHK